VSRLSRLPRRAASVPRRARAMIFDDSDDPFVAQGRAQPRPQPRPRPGPPLPQRCRSSRAAHARARAELIASLRATRAALCVSPSSSPQSRRAILEALEPLLHSRVSKSPAVAAELIAAPSCSERSVVCTGRPAVAARSPHARSRASSRAPSAGCSSPCQYAVDFLLGILPLAPRDRRGHRAHPRGAGRRGRRGRPRCAQ